MKNRKTLLAVALLGVSMLGLTGCANFGFGDDNIGTRVPITPANAAVAGTVTGTGLDLKCDPSLQTVPVTRDGDIRWQSSDIDYEVHMDGEAQIGVTVTVHGDVNAKAAIVHYYDTPPAEGAATGTPVAPTAVNWPYDNAGVKANFDQRAFSTTNSIRYIDLCVAAPAVEAAPE